MTADQQDQCPLCGKDNHCAMAAGKDVAACWCVAEHFPPELLAAVPPEDRNRRCICKNCVQQYGGTSLAR